jgi:hypothetical protein
VIADADEHALFDNPLFGLIAAYGYLMRGELRSDRWTALTLRLLDMLPHSPDVHLLHRLTSRSRLDGAGGSEGWTPFDSPPMFATGMEFLVREAAADAGLVPAHSWSAAVAATRTSGSVWTRWALDLDAQEQARALMNEVPRAGDEDSTSWALRVGLPQSLLDH